MEVGSLRGDRVTLRAWRAGDADWYVAARDEAVLAFTTERDELTVAEVVAAIEAARTSRSTAAFAIEDEHNRLVGNIAAEITDGAADISYFLAPDGRGRGLVTDAIRTVVRWLRSQPVASVRAVTANGNDASAASLARAGFQPAGPTEHPQLGPSTRWELALAAG